MKMALSETPIEQLSFNPFTKISEEWFLIVAGNESKHNAMTARWCGFGMVWNIHTATIYIRPQRYTYEFVRDNDYFTLCFFSEAYRKTLTFFGTKTGRDHDKAKETGLTPNFNMYAPYYEEADMVFICKKIYCQDIVETSFVADEDNALIKKNYPENDFHRMYVGQIETVLTKKFYGG
jgi:flavin reductase (DIM6/NTAB) family NADH-FMN oxidoreductase RutF